MTPTREFELRPAQASDAPELTAIAFAAKRHWGYPEAWIDLWSDELTIDGQYIDENWVVLAKQGDRSVGWCALSMSQGTYWIDYCWILPEAAGRGIGQTLVERALSYANDLEIPSIKVVADPNAEGFYYKLGFKRIGEHRSVPVGRVLPVLKMRL